MRPLSKPRRLRKTLQERLNEKLDKTPSPEGCWNWAGALSGSGYGILQRGRRGDGLVRAHRVAYELAHGPIPEGRLILHACDNKRCCNPAHLNVGDHSQNLKEAWARGLQTHTAERKAKQLAGFQRTMELKRKTNSGTD